MTCVPIRQLFNEGADGFIVCVKSWLVCGHQCQSFVICKKSKIKMDDSKCMCWYTCKMILKICKKNATNLLLLTKIINKSYVFIINFH